nr:2930_t:CDS:2 [Entrophospora candida]
MHFQENRDGENAVTHESLGESPSTLGKKFRNSPWVTKFINELAIQESINPNVISALLQTIYYDGANSLAIPHKSYSQLPFNSKDIVRIIETWLTENFSRAGDSIPILGNTLGDNVESINQRLRTELDFSGLNKVLVNIRAGHSFFSHMEGDVIVLDENQVEFFSRFPLFVTIFIKVEAKSTYTTNEEKCQVLVAVEHVTKKTQFPSPLSSA